MSARTKSKTLAKFSGVRDTEWNQALTRRCRDHAGPRWYLEITPGALRADLLVHAGPGYSRAMRTPWAVSIAALCLLAAGCDENKSDTKADKPADEQADPRRADPATGTAPTPDPTAAADTKATGQADPQASGQTSGQASGDPPAAETQLYYERKLTIEELEKRSLRDLTLIRNTIYARAGNSFRKPWLDKHFRAQPWYKPTGTIDEKAISDVDWANATSVAVVERALGPRELERRKDAILTAIGAGQPTEEQTIELKLLSARMGTWIGPEGVPKEVRTPLEDPSRLKKVLEWEDLMSMSRRDLRILRNTIYALHDRPFKSSILRQYFAAMPWYEPDARYTDKRLSKIDWANIKMIKTFEEEEFGGPLTEHRHTRILRGDEEDDFFVAA